VALPTAPADSDDRVHPEEVERVIPQAFPLTIWLRFEGEPFAEAVPAVVVGWLPAEDPGSTGSELGSRYAPVVLMDGDTGAWPVSLDACITYVNDPRGR
jgi:hypothetical protein